MSALPYIWRISKYNPGLRNSQGQFQGDEWTFFAQVSQSFSGTKLTYEDYVSVENAYVRSAMLFLADAGLVSLQIAELERPHVALEVSSKFQCILLRPENLRNDTVVRLDQLADLIRLNLRELTWCKLQEADKFYLHFGWDYYIYVGSTNPSLRAIQGTTQSGLYVEAKASPYL